MDTLTSVLTSTMRMTTPLLLASLGLVISERSGMMQVTAEGLMVLGAFCGYVAVTVFGASIFVATLFAMLICMIASLIFSVTTISMPCQQVIVGTAMNMFIPGLCLFLYRSIYISGEIKVAAFDTAAAIAIPGLSSIPVIGNAVFNQNMYTYFSYIMVFVVWFILYRTSLGNKIISAGEHPMAAAAAGINVARVRYGAVLFSAAMFGIAGAYLSLAQSGVFIDDMASGRGFITMAIVVLGRWNPFGVLFGSVLFGFATALQIMLQAMGVDIPASIILMIPYASTLLIVILCYKRRTVSPRALGVPLKG